MASRPVWLGIVPLALAGCIAPSVLEKEKRAVSEEEASVAWRPAEAPDLDGLFESVRIEGEASSSLWRFEYHFSQDGSFTGAALVVIEGRPEFQTLAGRWSLAAGVLALEGSEPARAFAAPGKLKLETEGGTAELRRVALR